MAEDAPRASAEAKLSRKEHALRRAARPGVAFQERGRYVGGASSGVDEGDAEGRARDERSMGFWGDLSRSGAGCWVRRKVFVPDGLQAASSSGLGRSAGKVVSVGG